MIRIGILSGDSSSTESIKLIQQFKDFKITGIAQNTEKQDAKDQQYTIEDLVSNSDATYFNIGNISVELIQMGIKKSNHLFLKKVPVITSDEIKQLINLVNEAGSNILLYNPYVFMNESTKVLEQLKIPHLINMRFPLQKTNTRSQLQDLLLFITTAEKSECKKIDVFAFEGDHKSSLINIHLAFSNGSMAQIHLGEIFKQNQSLIEIFQKDGKFTNLPIQQYGYTEELKIEKNALTQFIKAIQKKSTTSISLSELEQTIFILNEIRKKLNYQGYSLFD